MFKRIHTIFQIRKDIMDGDCPKMPRKKNAAIE